MQVLRQVGQSAACDPGCRGRRQTDDYRDYIELGHEAKLPRRQPT